MGHLIAGENNQCWTSRGHSSKGGNMAQKDQVENPYHLWGKKTKLYRQQSHPVSGNGIAQFQP